MKKVHYTLFDFLFAFYWKVFSHRGKRVLLAESYAPINVKPAGGRQGMGWGFDIFQKFAVKFPAHGQIIPVKCSQISPPWAAHCFQISQGRTQERHNENISK